ncbi:MAG: hypothetical protein MI717_14705 [Spirochaetales bacterium]|nr:hypothetical protein [Spirochaetales bacterium]
MKKRERLADLELTMEKNERRGRRLCWISWNPDSRYGYTVESALEDVRWMVYEIKQLRAENAELSSFVEHYKNEMKRELDRINECPETDNK